MPGLVAERMPSTCHTPRACSSVEASAHRAELPLKGCRADPPRVPESGLIPGTEARAPPGDATNLLEKAQEAPSAAPASLALPARGLGLLRAALRPNLMLLAAVRSVAAAAALPRSCVRVEEAAAAVALHSCSHLLLATAAAVAVALRVHIRDATNRGGAVSLHLLGKTYSTDAPAGGLELDGRDPLLRPEAVAVTVWQGVVAVVVQTLPGLEAPGVGVCNWRG
eukprot:CAMPEP_0206585374 /NCGR_PEP_ID=MMETSP0325_2-20121206/36379_1 /ASSEMBLY_ACC=CAM_ASM_000347 /TAXON_ID=2866 /ORGANISM="Crypthecodinium cohnii, Strain Seligo" /LENGTH=223 /DNA_ID=CAMNT_0054092909 /DNA_START=253 /DNA_END=927 /DNA_ORIENTATION=+